MRRREGFPRRWFPAFLAFLLLPWLGAAGGAEDWGYHPPIGPVQWAKLSPCNQQCADGGEQSPVDIVRPQPGVLPPLQFSYGLVPKLTVVNNGHTVDAQIPSNVPAKARTLRIGGVELQLAGFHFHTRSEHRVAGKDSPIEMHLVHRGPGGRLAVVGVFIERGQPPNAELSKFWNRLPKKKDESITVAGIDLAGLLPKSVASFRYGGSLTTPACGQGVQWNVLAAPIRLSQSQLDSFAKIFSGPQFPRGNRRPVQALNGRVVMTDVRP